MAAPFVTAPTIVDFDDNIAYQTVWTSTTSTGTFKLQGSLDNLSYADLGTAGIVASVGDVSLINANQIPFKYVRMSYTPTVAGDGVCTIQMSAKSVGA